MNFNVCFNALKQRESKLDVKHCILLPWQADRNPGLISWIGP